MAITTYAELQTAVENWIADTTINGRVLEFIALGEAKLWRDVRLRSRAIEEFADVRIEAAQAGGTAGGTANAPTVAVTGFTGPTLGDTVSFTAASSNTSSVMLNVESTGATALRKGDGTVELEANDLIAGHVYVAYFDGTRWRLTPRGAAPLPSRFLGAKRVFIDTDPNQPLTFLPASQFWTVNLSDTQGKPQSYTIEGDLIVFGPAPDAAYTVRILYHRRPTSIASAVPRLFTENPDLYLYAALIAAAPYLANDPRALTWAALYDDIADAIAEADKRDRYSAAPLVMQSGIVGP